MRCPPSHTVDNPTRFSLTRDAEVVGERVSCQRCKALTFKNSNRSGGGHPTPHHSATTGRTVQSITRLSLELDFERGVCFERLTPLIDRSKQDLSHTFVCERQGRQTNPLPAILRTGLHPTSRANS